MKIKQTATEHQPIELRFDLPKKDTTDAAGINRSREKRDLLIHYDEEAQKLVLYSVSTSETTDIRAREFGGVSTEVDYLKSMPPEEAEIKLGSLVFSLLDLVSFRKICIRPYEAELQEAHARFIEEVEANIATNDPEAQYQLFLHLYSLAIRNYSIADLARAEELLEAASAQGHEYALSSLESWPKLKAVVERRINRGPPTQSTD